MTRKRKYKRLYEGIVTIWLLIVLATIWLLMMKPMNASREDSPTAANETVIRLIETVEPSVETEKMLESKQTAVEVYKDILEVETATETQKSDVSNTMIESYSKTGEKAIKNDESYNENTISYSKMAGQDYWHYDITADEVRLIALIAELEDINAMCEIAEVILNRALSPKFPDSIEGVIYQPKQFHTVGSITDEMQPSNEAVEVAEAVFRDGASTVGEATFFAERSVKPQKIAKGLYLVEIAGGTAFYGQR